MVFSDQSFVFLFLPLVITLYFPLRGTRFAATLLLIASLTFYFWTSGYFVLLLVASILINYLGGLWIDKRRRKSTLIAVIALNLAPLVYTKYAFFVASNFPITLHSSIVDQLKQVVLPVGISFFTLQGISYVIDVWRRSTAPERNPIVFGAYLSFFPQLIAGPIVRYVDVARDYARPKVSMENFAVGASRFMHGLVKKILIADSVGRIADAAFAVPDENVVFAVALLGATAYAIQIYFDFSGYSDMAIGLGRMFGIRFLENFTRPYASRTVTEFWRRWHISLSSWFRDYIYIPLGGNRNGVTRTYGYLLIVFAITGFWHGAAWTFVVWALYQGAFIILERIALGNTAKQSPHGWLRFVYFLPVVLVGWIFFRADSIGQAWTLISALGAPFSSGAFIVPPALAATLTPDAITIFVLSSAIFFIPGTAGFGHRLSTEVGNLADLSLRTLYMTSCLAIAYVLVLAQNYSPFLYFRF